MQDNQYAMRLSEPLLSFRLQKILCLLCCTFYIPAAFCQDLITRTDSVKLEVKVLKVEPNYIHFKRYSDPEGLEYTISTANVLYIDHENGPRQVYEHNTQKMQRGNTQDYAVDLGRNIVRCSFSDLLFYRTVAVSYERLFPSGRFGIKVPVSVGLRPGEINHNRYEYYYAESYRKKDNIFSAGLALSFYPFGQGRMTYYMGPQLDVVKFKYRIYTYPVYDEHSQLPLPPPNMKMHKHMLYSLTFNNGAFYHITKNFIVGLDLGFGGRDLNYERIFNDANSSYFYMRRYFISGHLQVGYRF